MTDRSAAKLDPVPDVLELDVNKPEDIEAVADDLRERWGRVDGILHAIAFAPEDALGGNFLNTPVESAITAFQTSAFSLKALTVGLADLFPEEGASIVGLDFDAQVAWPVYDWMGVAKAALEATSRYLARDLGPRRVRVNLVSAGPLATLAARGIPGFSDLATAWEKQAPLPLGRRGPGAGRGDDQLPAQRRRAGDHGRGHPRRRRLPRDGHADHARPRGGRGVKLARLPDGRHGLPRHGGHGAIAREGRPRRGRARARGRRRRRPGAPGRRSRQALARPVALPRPRARRRRRRDRRPGWAWTPATRAAVAEEVGRGDALRRLDLVRPAARRGAPDQRRGHARDHRASPARRSRRRLDRFIHVSTAYVAGITKGTFREHQLDEGQEFRNTYEQTKWEAEHVVNDASDLNPVIARPSIVMGESGSGWTPAFNVLYWPIRAFSRGLFDEVPARPEALVDVVPVDYVADALVHLLEDTSSSGVVNLGPVARPARSTTSSG